MSHLSRMMMRDNPQLLLIFDTFEFRMSTPFLQLVNFLWLWIYCSQFSWTCPDKCIMKSSFVYNAVTFRLLWNVLTISPNHICYNCNKEGSLCIFHSPHLIFNFIIIVCIKLISLFHYIISCGPHNWYHMLSFYRKCLGVWSYV
jgi:hypothetical protein